jgi:hypothetical protein
MQVDAPETRRPFEEGQTVVCEYLRDGIRISPDVEVEARHHPVYW